MRSHSRVEVVGLGSGRSALARLVSEAPGLLRETSSDDAAVEVHLVAGAAGPLRGDVQHLDVVVHGGVLRVRSVAASFALPGRGDSASVASVEAVVAAGGELDWWPRPTVSVQGSEHRMEVSVRVDGGARLRWVDELVLGRHGEPGGRLTTVHRLVVDGRPLLVQQADFGGVEPSPGEHGDARVAITAVAHDRADVGTAGADQPTSRSVVVRRRGVRAVRASLAPGTTCWTVLADDHARAVEALAELGLQR